MEFSRQHYWSGLLFPPPGDLTDQESDSGLLHCRQILYHLSHQGSPVFQSDDNILYSHQKWQCLLFLILTSIWCWQCSKFDLFNKYVVLSHCFNFQFSGDIFLYIFLTSICLLCWCVSLGHLPIFQSGFKFSYCWTLQVFLYILEKSFSDVSFANLLYDFISLLF